MRRGKPDRDTISTDGLTCTTAVQIEIQSPKPEADAKEDFLLCSRKNLSSACPSANRNEELNAYNVPPGIIFTSDGFKRKFKVYRP